MTTSTEPNHKGNDIQGCKFIIVVMNLHGFADNNYCSDSSHQSLINLFRTHVKSKVYYQESQSMRLLYCKVENCQIKNLLLFHVRTAFKISAKLKKKLNFAKFNARQVWYSYGVLDSLDLY